MQVARRKRPVDGPPRLRVFRFARGVARRAAVRGASPAAASRPGSPEWLRPPSSCTRQRPPAATPVRGDQTEQEDDRLAGDEQRTMTDEEQRGAHPRRPSHTTVSGVSTMSTTRTTAGTGSNRGRARARARGPRPCTRPGRSRGEVAGVGSAGVEGGCDRAGGSTVGRSPADDRSMPADHETAAGDLAPRPLVRHDARPAAAAPSPDPRRPRRPAARAGSPATRSPSTTATRRRARSARAPSPGRRPRSAVGRQPEHRHAADLIPVIARRPRPGRTTPSRPEPLADGAVDVEPVRARAPRRPRNAAGRTCR